MGKKININHYIIMTKKKTLFDAVKEFDNDTFTTNGRAANKSTLSACLDFFGKAASYRKTPKEVAELFKAALLEDKETAVRALFYFRDIRGTGVGMGERDIFRVCLAQLASIDPDLTIKLLPLVPFYGRWDDMFGYTADGVSVFKSGTAEVRNAIAALVGAQLTQDLDNVTNKTPEKVSLLAKWLPNEKSVSKDEHWMATQLVNALVRRDPAVGSSSRLFSQRAAIYRRMRTLLNKTIDLLETRMTNKDYTFDYSKLPGKAALTHVAAFLKHDKERYEAYHEKLREALESGSKEVKFNASTLYPYEIIERVNNDQLSYNCSTPKLSDLEVDNMWKSLPNYFSDKLNGKNILVVGDTSGSMLSYNARPMTVACSLSMYTASHNTGIFKDKFILFSDKPVFVKLDSTWPVRQQVDTYIGQGFMCNNTNIDKVFKLILHAAMAAKLPQSEMPEMVIIVSDMQFDMSMGYTDERQVDTVRNDFIEAGYEVPKLVYWNVACNDYGNVPVTVNDKGAYLVNGCKPGLLELVLDGADPVSFMQKVLHHKRYDKLSAAFAKEK